MARGGLSCAEGSDSGSGFEGLINTLFHPTVYICHGVTVAVTTLRNKLHSALSILSRMFCGFHNVFCREM